MSDSGTRTKLKRILGLERIQSSLEPSKNGTGQTGEPSLTFEDAKQALKVLLAQVCCAGVRKAHERRIMGYLVLQEKRLRQLQRRCVNWGIEDDYDHLKSLAEFYDDPGH
jgi:hypothetical protein